VPVETQKSNINLGRLMPEIKIEITTCDDDKVGFVSKNEDFIYEVAKLAAEKVGYILQPTKKKGGGG
jgi:hypothetical protein